ncbi:MAG: hypothetical protein NZM12_07600 [Steroidobacteraceae bacterium]|nr:hypothetical protein [Steroidobacteraceae bacterium]MDW8259545.1 hypothetical protein [Gammaproteobacteria bacterium]
MPRPERRLAALAPLLCLLGACTLGGGWLGRGGPPPDSAAPELDDGGVSPLQAHLDAMNRLVQLDPALQDDFLDAARREAEDTRLAGARLRLALLLGTPGHKGFDPAASLQILNDILAVPTTLQPPERALAQIEVTRITAGAQMQTDMRRLREELERAERDRIAALNRRLQAEQEENARLRKALEEARAKLEAISTIERSTTGRKP